jgi:hypothetical protein
MVAEPALAENFHLEAYPLYPSGFEDNTRTRGAGGI